MLRKGLLTDRKKLICRLEQETGFKAVYAGAPTFRYSVGPYTIFRDGSLKEPEGMVEGLLLRKLEEEGLIEGADDPSQFISFPADQFQGKQLVNLVNMISARNVLINKAIGVPNAFHMSASLMREMKRDKPATRQDFLECVHRCGGKKAMRGICITQDRILFPGFPVTEECRQLAEHIVETSLKQKWSKQTAIRPENEKYTFRVWLNAIGMKGEAYKKARELFLENLDGDGTYRTPDQREAYNEKVRQRRCTQPEFVVL